MTPAIESSTDSSRTPQTRRSGYMPTLDGWRAIAVGLVLLSHAGLPPWHGFGFDASFGRLGVDLFFAISGILICSRLLEEERVNGRISLRGFYIRRTFRIFPPAYLFLGIVALMGLAHVVPNDWAAWSSAVVFLRNYFTTFVRDTAANRFTGHFWSLAVEEHFYVLLPGLLVLFPKRRKTVLIGLIAVTFAWLLFYMAHTPPQLRQLYWERRTDLSLNSLLFPALLALLLADPAVRARFQRFVTPMTICILFIALAAGAAVAKKYLVHPPAAPPVQIAASAPADPDSPVAAPRKANDQVIFFITTLIVPVVFPFVILATMLHPTTLVSRFLELLPMRAIGRISYSLYLWQQVFWVPNRYVHWPIGVLQIHWIGMPLTFLCAIGSYILIEKPAIRLGHRFAPPPTPGHADLRVQTNP